VALLNGTNVFTGTNRFTGVAIVTNANNQLSGSFSGDGSGLTGLTPSQIPNLDASQITSGTFSTAQIPNLDASKITTGALIDARLSGNVALLNGTNVFIGTNRFTGIAIVTNSNNQLSGTFSGDGSGLTGLTPSQIPNLDASKITTGALTDARLSGNVALLNGTNVFIGTNRFTGVSIVTNANNQFSGAFGGNGSGLTNVNASSLGGTDITTNSAGIVLGDTLNVNLHPVYLKATGDGNHGVGHATSTTNFNGLNAPDGPVLWGYNGGALVSMNPGPRLGLVWNNSGVGVGATNPASALHVASPSGDAEISIQSGDAGNHRWTVQSSGLGTPGLVSSLQIIDRTAGASRMTIHTNGNVTIPGNVTNSGSAIFNGSATFNGSTKVGANPVTVGAESLRILRGEVAGTGAIDFGSGFTVTKNGTGDLTLNFSSSFSSTPAVTVTIYGNLVIPTLFIVNASSAQIKFYNPSGTATDPNGFDFIAIGP